MKRKWYRDIDCVGRWMVVIAIIGFVVFVATDILFPHSKASVYAAVSLFGFLVIMGYYIALLTE